MGLAQEWFSNHLDIVFFIYGLGFIVMGITIFVHPKKNSEFSIANHLWLLAAFGISHGINEHLDMWAIIKGRTAGLDLVRWFILIISYLFLFEFGRKLLNQISPGSSLVQKKAVKLLRWWITPVICFVILLSGLLSSDFWLVGSIWTRYLFGLTGGIFIGTGFYMYYTDQKETLKGLNVKKYFLGLSLAFFAYGILGGLIVPKGSFIPARWLNTESFYAGVGVPVQVFRAMCALTAAWAVAGMLKIFNWETIVKLESYQLRLREMIVRESMLEELERKRIAEGLHDQIGQNLAMSKIRLENLIKQNPDVSEDVRKTLGLIEATIRDSRSLTFELSTPVLYELGFIPAVEWLVEQIDNTHSLKAECIPGDSVCSIKGEMSVLLYKTVRELLYNIVKHADAGKATVSIDCIDTKLRIIVRDDGVGFDISAINPYLAKDGGFGLLNVRERINYLGGTFTIDSEAGKGTRVEIVVQVG